MNIPVNTPNLENHAPSQRPSNPQLQDLRAIIVQIRDSTNEEVVGTGFVIQGGYILTCAHVVMAAGVNPSSCGSLPETYRSFFNDFLGRSFFKERPTEDTLWIRFPQAKASGSKDYRARVRSCLLNDYEDDIVLLELVNSQIPPGVEYARIGLAKPTTLNAMSEDRRFRSFGFRRLGDFGAAWCDGETQGFVYRPSGRNLQQEPLQLLSSQISPGMSGAPVLDITRNLVIGMIAETWNAWNSSFRNSSFHDRDTAFATAMEVVRDDPFKLILYPEVFSTSTPYPSSHSFYDLGEFTNSDDRSLRIESIGQLNGLVIDSNLHASIQDAWRNNAINCCQISQYERRNEGTSEDNGNSRSSMAQVFLGLNAFPENERPKRILWWDFSTRPYFEEFLDSIFPLFNIDPGQIPSFEVKLTLIRAFFVESRNLLVLNVLSSEISVPTGRNLSELISQLVPGNSLCLLII
jgi:Trypsin-like peptidase domain